MVDAAQTWTLLGILGVFVVAVVSLMIALQQSMGAQLGSLRGYLDAKFAIVDPKIDALDRDVQVLMDRVFRERP